MGVIVGLGVAVGVSDGMGVLVGVAVCVGVGVTVDVGVTEGVRVGVGVLVGSGVGVGVGAGLPCCGPNSHQLACPLLSKSAFNSGYWSTVPKSHTSSTPVVSSKSSSALSKSVTQSA